MIPTPDTGKLDPDVYDPAEDSFLLLDALEEDAQRLGSKGGVVALEIGSGSGVVSAFLARVLREKPCLTISTDINAAACLATQYTARLNSVDLHPICTSLVDGLAPRLRATGGADIILFNPPYVPTEADELAETQDERSIGAAWAGGADGMGLTDEVLEMVPSLLARGGLFYLVAVKQNDPEGIIARMRHRGLDGEIVKHRRAGRESLYILRFVKR